jgi:bifunctional non-homologous end joining protein LigD
MQEQSISLYSRHAGANKQYHVYLRRSNDLWVVDFAHAGVGKPLKTGTKTAKPIPYDQALKKFNSLVKEKKEGESHYVEGPSGASYQSPVTEKTLFGVFPQQPAAITRAELELLVEEPDWGFQEKANGENRTLRAHNGHLTGGNKKGFTTPVPANWAEEFTCLGDFVANGEHVGDKFYAFDLLQIGSTDLRDRPQRERYEALAQLHARFRTQTPSFEVLTCHYSQAAKRDLIATVEANRGEGVVAKDGAAAYEDGRNKNTLKFVFRDVATCIVIGINAQRSVQVGLLNKDSEVVPCGNVTIPSNKEIPALDDLIDVKYLYFAGAFEQPVFDPDNKGPRQDVDRFECNFEQILRFKPVKQEIAA